MHPFKPRDISVQINMSIGVRGNEDRAHRTQLWSSLTDPITEFPSQSLENANWLRGIDGAATP